MELIIDEFSEREIFFDKVKHIEIFNRLCACKIILGIRRIKNRDNSSKHTNCLECDGYEQPEGCHCYQSVNISLMRNCIFGGGFNEVSNNRHIRELIYCLKQYLKYYGDDIP